LATSIIHITWPRWTSSYSPRTRKKLDDISIAKDSFKHMQEGAVRTLKKDDFTKAIQMW
jgi:hypothetical protein